MILVFYDLETTGFSKQHNDIIEISAIAWNNETEEIEDTFSSYIKPTTLIPTMITQLTGISNFKVKDCAGYWDVAPQFFAWLKNWKPDAMVGYNNTVFDWPFITTQNLRYNINGIDNYKQIDVLKIVREMKKNGLLDATNLPDVKQVTVAKYFNIDYDAHDAIEDVKALLKIYIELRKINPTLM